MIQLDLETTKSNVDQGQFNKSMMVSIVPW